MPKAVTGVEFLLPFVCLFLRTISQNPMQLGSLNVTYKNSKVTPGNPFIFGLIGQFKATSHKAVPAWVFALS